MAKRWERPTVRRTPTRSLFRYLIVCEDSKSCLDYLLAFEIPKDFAEIVPEGGAGNTVSVVERGIELKAQAEKEGAPFSHVWCVFDRDEHPTDRYRRAFELGRLHNDLTVIWGNECFELWYLLHFCYRDTAIGRAELRKEISKPDRLNRKYEKCDKEVFALLQTLTGTAIRNAEKLAKFNRLPAANPSTNIHRLVSELLKLQAAANES